MTILGNNIKSIREHWGLTQGQFAELLNASRSKIAQYESRGVMPNNETLSRLAELTGLNKDDLLERPLTRPQLPKMPSGIDTSSLKEQSLFGANPALHSARVVPRKELDLIKENEKREKAELTREIIYLQELRVLLSEKVDMLTVHLETAIAENRELRAILMQMRGEKE